MLPDRPRRLQAGAGARSVDAGYDTARRPVNQRLKGLGPCPPLGQTGRSRRSKRRLVLGRQYSLEMTTPVASVTAPTDAPNPTTNCEVDLFYEQFGQRDALALPSAITNPALL
jgi:hypothetical protein